MKNDIGVYGIVDSHWKENAYPLDLWLEHHSKIFDEVVLVQIGDFKIPFDAPNIKTRVIDDSNNKGLKWYIDAKTEAQRLCSTEWKVQLDVDEFVNTINTDTLNKDFIYPLKYIHFYGSLSYKIENIFPSFQWRIHTGRKPIDMHAANLNGMQYPISPLSAPVYHTNTCRNPEALSNKWIKEQSREFYEREHNPQYKYYPDVEKIYNVCNTGAFKYSIWNELWPNAKLVHINSNKIPKILTDNSDRFTHWIPEI